MRPVRLGAAGVAGLLASTFAAPALADVTVDAAPRDDGTTALRVALADGCGEQRTTGLTLRVPGGTALVAATAPQGWDHELDDEQVAFTGSAAPGAATEFVLTVRLGAEAGETVALEVEEACDGSDPVRSTARVAVTCDLVDPRMAVREPADVPPGADGRDVAVAVAGFAAVAGAGALLARRRR